jgi:hypothetical protein
MNTRSRTFRRLNLESFETRITPASASVTYTDIDGDIVRITASLPGTAIPPLDAGDLTLAGGQLQTLTLTEAGFDGARIVFSVTKKPGGDGLAHVGFINATGRDLDRVVVKGDLGRIVAGDAVTANDPGLNLLQVRTMGTLGLFTQGGAGDLDSVITGKLSALKVAGDFTDAFLETTGGADGQIGSIFIGGDLTGGVGLFSGRISTSGAVGDVRIGGSVNGGTASGSGQVISGGAMGIVRIGGSLTGGAGTGSALVFSSGAMGNVRIGGSVTGGAGSGSGQVNSGGAMGVVRIGGSLTGGTGSISGLVRSIGAMGDVRIGGTVTGGTGSDSGMVLSSGAMGDVRIGGSLTGGAGGSSGLVSSNSAMGDVRIGGSLIGGSITGTASLTNSGNIQSGGRIASVTIGGSLVAGSDASTGTLTRCGAIVAGDDIGPVKIGGNILGNSTNPALIIARGQEVKPLAGFDVAIASLRVGGDVRFARILAGFDFNQVPSNADASIGAVVVGRDWVASSIVAGAEDTGADGFGINDSLQTVDDTALVARIASITIKGDASGSLIAGDHFGFVAQQIDKLRIGSRVFVLDVGPSNDSFAIPFTDDLRLLEVS